MIASDWKDTRQIGRTHVPGISIQVEEPSGIEQRSVQVAISEPVSPFEGANNVKSTKDDSKPSPAPKQHPLETITIKAKPGGPLPPVAIHDQPNFNIYHYPK